MMGVKIPLPQSSNTSEQLSSELYSESRSPFVNEYSVSSSFECELLERVRAAVYAKRRLLDATLRLQERMDLLRFVRMGNEAREQLIRANMRYVLSSALENKNDALPVEALIQEGNLALLMAVDSYSLDSDISFCDYAKERVDNAIQNALAYVQ